MLTATNEPYKIVLANQTGGKAGKGRNKTSSVRVIRNHGKYYEIIKIIRFKVNDEKSFERAYNTAKGICWDYNRKYKNGWIK